MRRYARAATCDDNRGRRRAVRRLLFWALLVGLVAGGRGSRDRTDAAASPPPPSPGPWPRRRRLSAVVLVAGALAASGFATRAIAAGPAAAESVRHARAAAVSIPALPTIATAPATTTPPAPAPAAPAAPMWAFDICETPTVEQMDAWKASPYGAIGIYIAGAARACPNPALDNPWWVQTVMGQGWKLLPVYVGPQAPCTDFTVRMSSDPHGDGLAAADDAANHANMLGLPFGAPIYADVEAYQGDGGCSAAVQAFLAGWTERLHARHFTAGVYGNDDSAIAAAAGSAAAGQTTVDAIWIAHWTGTPQLGGYPSIPDGLWTSHQRSHQHVGDHWETWGGVSLDIDSNWVDGPVAP